VNRLRCFPTMTITKRILLNVAIGTGLVVAVVTAVTYLLVFRALKQRDLQNLQTYVAERALREEARFQQVQSNLLLVRGQFLIRMAAPRGTRDEATWNYWYRYYPDGAWRTRETFSDARKYTSLWTHKNWQDTPEARKRILVAQELCDELLPGWVDAFPSVFFNFPGPATIGFDARLPSWVWDMPSDYDTTGMEWIELSLPKQPREGFSWTGVQQDSVVSNPLVSVFLPIFRDGEFLGSVGHDIFVGGILDEATQSHVPGASHFIFRPDGRLIAHPTKRAEILKSKGLLTALGCGDPAVGSLYRTALAQRERRFSGFDPAADAYYSVARLSGPEWYYVTTMSRAQLQAQAFASAQWVLWSGLISLGLVLGFIAVILQHQVARPLAQLATATRAMISGDLKARASVEPATDELGALSASFDEMVARVEARDAELRSTNAGLEHRVTERTAELRAALEREKELGEMKSNFVSLVSHEFRTPLGVIMSATEVLQRYFERLATEKRARHLEMIFRSTKMLASLIEEVLLLSKVEAGRLQFTPEPVDVQSLCRHLVDEVQSATDAACPMECVTEGDLTGAVSDEGLLRHIFTNLLTNACKYSEPGSPVEFHVRRDRREAIFTVRDRGIGIPEEDQDRIFQSFTRARNVGERPGTGLGLVIVRHCVELHGGRLHFESAVGRGTVVTIALPIFQESPASLQTPELVSP
jgi:signal transduction histidine kinase